MHASFFVINYLNKNNTIRFVYYKVQMLFPFLGEVSVLDLSGWTQFFLWFVFEFYTPWIVVHILQQFVLFL